MARCRQIATYSLLVGSLASAQEKVAFEPPPIPPPWQYREGARIRLAKRGHADVAKAIQAGLDWLSRSQQQDGSLPDGVRPTALATLAWLGDGSTMRIGDHVDRVRRSIIWLKDQQGQQVPLVHKGFIGAGTLTDHAIATTAIIEAQAMSQYKTLRRYAQIAVDALLIQQGTQSGAVPALPGPPTTRGALAPWSAMALHTASLAELQVSDTWKQDLVRCIDALTDPATGRYRVLAGEKPGTEPGDPALPPASLTAGLLFARTSASPDWRKDPQVEVAAEALLRTPPGRRDDPAQSAVPIDPLAAWLAGKALRQVNGPRWERWLHMLTQELLGRQATESEAGSWDPAPGLDRVSTTALAVLCLQLNYDRSQ